MGSLRSVRVNRVAVMLKEYQALRSEVIAALNHRLQIWSFGSAAVGVLIAGSLTALSDGDEVVWPVVMAFIVPVLCVGIYHTWLAEVRRGRRASWYLWGLERRVNAKLRACVLCWEEQLRAGGSPQTVMLKGHFVSTMLFFAVTAAVCGVIGARALLDITVPRMPGVWPWAFAVGWGLVPAAVCAYWHCEHMAACEKCEKISAEGWPEPIPSSGQQAATSVPSGGFGQMADNTQNGGQAKRQDPRFV